MVDLSSEERLELQDSVSPKKRAEAIDATDYTEVARKTGVQVLDDVLPDGLPDPCMLLILADPTAGKEFLTTEFLHNRLKRGDRVLWVSLENFTDDLRTLVDAGGFAGNPGGKGKLAFVDCYSSQIGMKSRERFSADPANLPNLSIVTSLAMSEVGKDTHLLVVLDSLSSLIQKVGVRASTEFFRMLVAKARHMKADLLAPLNRLAFSPIVLAAFQEIAEGVLELTVKEDAADIRHFLRVRKMARVKYDSSWIPYRIDHEHRVLRRIPLESIETVQEISEPIQVDALTLNSLDRTNRDPGENQENLSVRLAALGETVAMVGHDLRNPLQVMINKLYLTKKAIEKLDPTQSEAVTDLDLHGLLGDLEEQIGRMNKVVSNLQDFGRLEPMVRETDLKKLVSETLSTITVPKTVKLSVEIEADVPMMMLDPILIRRALANLIINAIQSMPEGGDLRILGARKTDAIVISIRDTGLGMPKEILGKIFNPLFTAKSDGTSFGLSISKRFVESHNGTIEVESEVGKGSTFTVRLPLSLA